MSSAICFNLDESKILLSGKELIHTTPLQFCAAFAVDVDQEQTTHVFDESD